MDDTLTDTLTKFQRILCDDTACVSYAECCTMLLSWMQEFDRGQECDVNTGLNAMHVAAMSLCVIFHNANLQEYTEYALKSELGDFYDRIALCDAPVSCMSWQQLQDIVSTVQIEFNDMFTRSDAGQYICIVNIQKLLVVIMSRMGFFLRHKWRALDSDTLTTDVSIDDMRGNMTVDTDGWTTIRHDSVVHIVTGLHAVAAGSLALLSAQHISVPEQEEELVELYNHHREASLDDFYEISQMADTPFGSVSQYKHKFRHLFHSTSQVVYFHYPSYIRRKQVALSVLQAQGAEPIALLPLLMQVQPDMKVLHEHTGIGHKHTHSQNKWHWSVVGNRVLLTNSQMHHFDAFDLKTLLLHAQTAQDSGM
tara:strand:- start:536 stop:1633 length:1098 start_codon:yes stop_codon:yes gene_type:complete